LISSFQVEAWQQVSLEELPPVLLLHLKWFDYKPDGCSKIMKTVEYSVDLRIENSEFEFITQIKQTTYLILIAEILSNKKSNYTAKQKIYKLFAGE
jgi:ubiquitin carboxyl-terminal hydrolase 10